MNAIVKVTLNCISTCSISSDLSKLDAANHQSAGSVWTRETSKAPFHLGPVRPSDGLVQFSTIKMVPSDLEVGGKHKPVHEKSSTKARLHFLPLNSCRCCQRLSSLARAQLLVASWKKFFLSPLIKKGSSNDEKEPSQSGEIKSMKVTRAPRCARVTAQFKIGAIERAHSANLCSWVVKCWLIRAITHEPH